MKTTLRNGALALTVIAGSALVAAPAMADHDRRDRHGDWDHHWKKHGHRHWDRDYAYRYRHHHRHHHRYYGWGWPYFSRPGFSLYIR